MISLNTYLCESLKPKADKLNDNQLKTYAFNYIKQWSTGELTEKDDCADIKKIDDAQLKDIYSFLVSVLKTDDIKKLTTILVNDVIKEIENKVDKSEIDKRYEDIVKIFSKRRVEIMRLAWALGKSNAEIVAQIYVEVIRTADKKRLENIANN